MECPHCKKEIKGMVCPECDAEIPSESRFCMACGVSVEKENNVAPDPEGDGFDIENRVLCPDGACTGIIIDGKCIECGKSS